MSIQTRTKLMLSARQQQAALTIFGTEQGLKIIAEALQKSLDDLAQKLVNVAEKVKAFDDRLTRFEIRNNYPLGGYFFKQNGRPAEGLGTKFFEAGSEAGSGLAGSFFGGGK